MTERRQAVDPRVWMAVVLDAVAGFVDAMGFLLLFQLFAANMSGNSVLAGVALGQGQWEVALRQALPIPIFVVGVMIGKVIVGAVGPRGQWPRVADVMAVELGLLTAFVLVASRLPGDGTFRPTADWQLVLLTALLALPMGVQNEALRRVGGIAVWSTFVTGTLSSLAESLTAYWRARTAPRAAGDAPAEAAPGRQALLLAGQWVAYVAGAVLGAALSGRWAFAALAVPLLVLCLMIVVDLRLAAASAGPERPRG